MYIRMKEKIDGAVNNLAQIMGSNPNDTAKVNQARQVNYWECTL